MTTKGNRLVVCAWDNRLNIMSSIGNKWRTILPQLCMKGTYNAIRSRVGHESELHPWLMLAKQNYHLTKVSIFSGEQRLPRDCQYVDLKLQFSYSVLFSYGISLYLLGD